MHAAVSHIDPLCHITVNRVIGNFIVESDPIFGGGKIQVTGRNADGSIKQRMALDEQGFQVESVGDVKLKAAHATEDATAGHKVMLKAGDGKRPVGTTYSLPFMPVLVLCRLWMSFSLSTAQA